MPEEIKQIFNPETVESIYDRYRFNKLLVNRRYQRKLVWGIEEKRSFIDSISLLRPVPLFLLAEIKHRGAECLEIIDGMQRLDSIVSFIEGDFKLNGKYFDLDSMSGTKLLLDNGELHQKTPKLSREECRSIASYKLPISISSISDESIVDDIFVRINSNGKKLSKQELRQAGSENKFAYLVRKLSENIRGDISHEDRLLLSNMKQISINNFQLPYGIDLGGIFWSKHGIITTENIRVSRDEELVAHLLAAILLGEDKLHPTSKNLDKLYDSKNHLAAKAQDEIIKQGETYLHDMFLTLFSKVKETFESTGSNFQKILFKQKPNYVNRAYQVAFLSFYEILVIEGKQIPNPKNLAKNLVGIGDSLLGAEFKYFDQRQKLVKMFKGLMQPYCEDATNINSVLSSPAIKLESLLKRSITENSNYDFKIGVHSMDDKNAWNEKLLGKICKTATAINNLDKNSIGYILLGVADRKEHAEKHKQFYCSDPKLIQNFFVTGLDGEIKLYQRPDHYVKKVIQSIKSSDIDSKEFKDTLAANVELLQYDNRSVLLITIKGGKDPIKYGGKYFGREGSDTVEIEDRSIWSRFL